MKFSKEVFFEPWICSNYSTGGIFGKKILALGESHYCDVEECGGCMPGHRFESCDMTSDVVRKYIEAETSPEDKWVSTFRKFERFLVNDYTESVDSKNIWESIAFYNYLQIAISGVRKAGESNDYKDSETAFFEVLNKLRPDLVIVWGKRLYFAMPGDRWQEDKPIMVGKFTAYTGSYEIKGGTKIRVIAINHPSTAFSWDAWHVRVLKPELL